MTTASTQFLPSPRVSGGLPVLGHAIEFVRDPVGLVNRGLRECGDMFSFQLARRTAVALVGHENMRFFFSETDRRLATETAYPFLARMFDPDFYWFAEPDEYKRQRNVILPRFHSRELDAYLAVMVAEARALAETLGDGGEFDLTSTFGPLVMRVAARCFIGPNTSLRLDKHFFDEFRTFTGGADFLTPPWLPLPHKVRSRRARARLRAALSAVLSERRRRPVDPPDFLQGLAEARYENGAVVPDPVLVNLLMFLIWSGHETTSGQISWALIDLLQNPEHLNEIRDERHDVLRDTDPVTVDAVQELRHLDRALHETERLHPVVYMMVRTAKEDIEHHGNLIPRGAVVIASSAATHRLAEVFPDPDRFRPERFAERPQLTRELIGFGGGVHRCLGVHFAYLEMKAVLTVLLRRFDFDLVDRDPGTVPGTRAKWPASPCRVRYRRRDRG